MKEYDPITARSLEEYLSQDSTYKLADRFSGSVTTIEGVLPEIEKIRVATSDFNVLLGDIRDFYEIFQGAYFKDHSIGAMTFTVPSGLVSVITTPLKKDVLVTAKYIQLK